MALEWRAGNEGKLSELEREFLVASEALKVCEEEEREATRRRELEAAQKLAEIEKQRAATSTKNQELLYVAEMKAAFRRPKEGMSRKKKIAGSSSAVGGN